MATTAVANALRRTTTDNDNVTVVEGTDFFEWTWKATDKGGGVFIKPDHARLQFDFARAKFVLHANIFPGPDCLSPFSIEAERLHLAAEAFRYAGLLGFSPRTGNGFYDIRWDSTGAATSITWRSGSVSFFVTKWKTANDASINPPAAADDDEEESDDD